MVSSPSQAATSSPGDFFPRLLSRPETWIGLVVLIAGAYFCGSGSWNQNARLDAIFTFVEPGPHRCTFRLDPFLPFPERSMNTGDWSLHGEHYYANKAPGTILLGVIAYAPLYALEAALGLNVDHPVLANLNAYWINLWVSVVPLSVASVCSFRLLARRMPAARASAIALLTFFGTALFPYSTQLWGHTTAAAFVVMAWWCFDGGSDSRGPSRDVATGMLAGLAVLSDFLAFPAALALLVGVFLRRRSRLPWLCLGGVGPLIALLVYQWYCFDSPWTLPTAGTRAAFLDETRVLGLFAGVDPTALFQITLGGYRGAFVQMPLLLGGLAGHAWALRRAPRAFEPWACVGVFALSLLMVASFNGWHGGATVCARYLIPAMPLLALGIGGLPPGRRSNALLALVSLPSLCNMAVTAAVSPLAPDKLDNPLTGFVYPRFGAGDLHPLALPIRLQALRPDFSEWRHLTVWNFGDVLGLAGLWRLLPLALVVLLAVVALVRITGEDRVRTPAAHG